MEIFHNLAFPSSTMATNERLVGGWRPEQNERPNAFINSLQFSFYAPCMGSFGTAFPPFNWRGGKALFLCRRFPNQANVGKNVLSPGFGNIQNEWFSFISCIMISCMCVVFSNQDEIPDMIMMMSQASRVEKFNLNFYKLCFFYTF